MESGLCYSSASDGYAIAECGTEPYQHSIA